MRVLAVKADLLNALLKAVGVEPSGLGEAGLGPSEAAPLLAPKLRDAALAAARDLEGLAAGERRLLEEALSAAGEVVASAERDPEGLAEAFRALAELYERSSQRLKPSAAAAREASRLLPYFPVFALSRAGERVVLLLEGSSRQPQLPEWASVDGASLRSTLEAAEKVVWGAARRSGWMVWLGPVWDLKSEAFLSLEPGKRPRESPPLSGASAALQRLLGALSYRAREAASAGFAHPDKSLRIRVSAEAAGGAEAEVRVLVRDRVTWAALRYEETCVHVSVSMKAGPGPGVAAAAHGSGLRCFGPLNPGGAREALLRAVGSVAHTALLRVGEVIRGALEKAEGIAQALADLGLELSDEALEEIGEGAREKLLSLAWAHEATSGSPKALASVGARSRLWDYTLVVWPHGSITLFIRPRGEAPELALGLFKSLAWSRGLEVMDLSSGDGKLLARIDKMDSASASEAVALARTVEGSLERLKHRETRRPGAPPPEALVLYAVALNVPELEPPARLLLGATRGDLRRLAPQERTAVRLGSRTWYMPLGVAALAAAAEMGTLRLEPGRLLVKSRGRWVEAGEALLRALEDAASAAGLGLDKLWRSREDARRLAGLAATRTYTALVTLLEGEDAPAWAVEALTAGILEAGGLEALVRVLASARVGDSLPAGLAAGGALHAVLARRSDVKAALRSGGLSGFLEGCSRCPADMAAAVAAAALGPEEAAQAIMREAGEGRLRGERLWGAVRGFAHVWPTLALGLAAKLGLAGRLLAEWLGLPEDYRLPPVRDARRIGAVWPALTGTYLVALARSLTGEPLVLLAAQGGDGTPPVFVALSQAAARLALGNAGGARLLHLRLVRALMFGGVRPAEAPGGVRILVCASQSCGGEPLQAIPGLGETHVPVIREKDVRALLGSPVPSRRRAGTASFV